MILGEFLDKHYSKEEQIALTNLDCSRSGITSLKGIENLVNLKYLYCNNNNLSSFSCASLKGIEYLVNLVNLEYLNCYDSNLTSLEGIENLVNLTQIDCSRNNLSSLKGIENLVNLEDIFCYGNPLPYSDLKDFNKIILQVKKEVRQEKIEKLLNS